VTVSDVENPADAASTSFMLTVESDGVEPQPPVVAPEPKPQPNKDSGGALGGLSMLFALGVMIRRRKAH
ncbi:MAG: GlyGly-CTERM sorting domain-containing protein, partial [Shewanella sp.]